MNRVELFVNVELRGSTPAFFGFAERLNTGVSSCQAHERVSKYSGERKIADLSNEKLASGYRSCVAAGAKWFEKTPPCVAPGIEALNSA